MMADTLLPDDPQTVRRLDSVACLLDWIRSMPEPIRKRFFGALAECNDAIQQVVGRLLVVVKNPNSTAVDRQRALTAMSDALFPNAEEREVYGLDLVTAEAAIAAKSLSLTGVDQVDGTQEAMFSRRLREVMESKRISQRDLAERVGCSQPAISQMLNRNCRPQKKTILRLAEALDVKACDLWPDIEVAETLDAVVSFQQNDYEMTEAEARALSETTQPNRPKIQPKSLPNRHR